MTKRNEMKDAEALGHIKTMPEVVEAARAEAPPSVAIDNPEEFRLAVGQAQMEGIDHLLVTEKLMSYLLRGNKSESLTYGDPGIRIFVEGTKEEIERVERMNAEQFQTHYIKKMRGG